MSQDPVALLVSKIDSNIALLMTPDRLTVIEYPVTLLPEEQNSVFYQVAIGDL
ncbi:hypothetical protein MIR68_008429 [Amoeboaphelidium protococcarum]|nr:hypothetical protein MIR68_008429 [Amoeboaphelidium protococcarum]